MLSLLALTLLASPPSFERTYSFWLNAERVGSVRIRFDGQRFRYDSTRVTQRDGAFEVSSFWCETDADGVGTNQDGRSLRGPEPSTLALLHFADGAPPRCLPAEDEHDGHPGEVCGERHGATLAGLLLHEPFRAELGSDGAVDELAFPKQGVRFVAEHGPLPLPRPRDLFGMTLPGPDRQSLTTMHGLLLGHSAGCEVSSRIPPVGPPSRDAPLPPPGSPGPMLDVARDATRGDRTIWAASRHLAAFVDAAIASAPPEVDEHDPMVTWKRRRGGCVGHAAVFASLARALGLQVRTAYGLLDEDGGWHIHAWNEVEVAGVFVGIDPSRGSSVGAEHLPVVYDDDPDPLRPGRCLLALPSMQWTLPSHL